MLECGGDLLDSETADRSVDWILHTLEDPSAFLERTHPTYLPQYKLVETLAAVVPAASMARCRSVLKYL